MTPEYWERIQTIFNLALERPESDRRAYVENTCAGEPALIADVLAMIEEDSRAASLLDRDVGVVAYQMFTENVAGNRREIGPYRLERILGEGGMGVVYLARREDVGNVAAIKLLRDAWMSPARRERFRIEQRTLAQLIHPGIARLYDAGTTPEGTPWFAMEYIEGEPLTNYCNHRQSSLTERLRLFRSVCEAVDYAHRHAVIHRDLKPTNILVMESAATRQSGSATARVEVKLLDFGIAKQLDADDLPGMRTRTGLRLMTPAYASPEQIRGESLGIHTDVYSLGVLLYELLAGRLPFHPDGGTPANLERAVLEATPERPSAIARWRGAPKSGWADLDVLCLTAMHKDPERRYRSVEALIRDLDHYLDGEPLEARPDRLSYRMAKFLRRNRVPALITTAACLVLLTMVVFFTVNLTRARNEAVGEAARTQRIQRFMLNLFEAGNRAAGPSSDLKVVDLLDRGIQEAKALDREPLVQAELYMTLGGIYRALGKFDQADSLLRLALDQRREKLGNDHADVARSTVDLGSLRIEQAKLDEAEKLITEGLEKAKRVLQPGDAAIAEATLELGRVLDAQGAYEKAVPVLEEALRLTEANGRDTPEVADTLNLLSSPHFYLGHYDRFDEINHRALELYRRLYGERHPMVADTLINLGASQYERGNYSKAEEYYREALAIVEAFYGPDHYETASTLTHLSRPLGNLKRYDEAQHILERALAIQERVNGPVHPRVASALNELGRVAVSREHYAEAESRFRRAADIYKTIYNGKHYYIGVALANLAGVYVNSGQYERAEALFQEVLRIYAETLPPDHLNVGIAHIRIGRLLLRQKRYQQAEEQSRIGYEIVLKQASPSNTWLENARTDLAQIYEALHQPEKADQFRAALKK